jgi:hypothetical protein
MKTVKMNIQILTKSFLDFMRGKTLIVTVILQGFKRLDISKCLIFSFQNRVLTFKVTMLERCTLQSTKKFHRHSEHHTQWV